MDVDAGIDDALAIIFASRTPELHLRAITTVSGNVHVDKTSMNVLKVLDVLGSPPIPVAKGMAKPLLRELETAEDFHGRDGLGDSGIPAPTLQLDRRHAVDLLIQETSSAPKQVTIIATAPLTNVAAAILRDPDFATNVKDLMLMGGAYNLTPYGNGNVNPSAEFNIYTDPEAARIVFKSRIPVTAVGVDVTTDPTATLTRELYRKFSEGETRLARFGTLITEKAMKKYGFFHLHDPITVAIAADSTLTSTKKYHVDVETIGNLTRGQTVADRRNYLPEGFYQKPNASICTSIDGERFLRMFLERFVS